jgi:hypothetical protein
MGESLQGLHTMSVDTSNLTLAERARRAAENLKYIAEAADQARPAALQLNEALKRADMEEMDHIIKCVERTQGPDEAGMLWELTMALADSTGEQAGSYRPGDLILGLASNCRRLEESLRQCADDIEAEDDQRRLVPLAINMPHKAPDGPTAQEMALEGSGTFAAPKIDLEAQAIALLFKHPELSVAEIADKLGVDRKTLYKKKKFRQAAELKGVLNARGPKTGSPRRGFKTSDRRIEAYANEDDED